MTLNLFLSVLQILITLKKTRRLLLTLQGISVSDLPFFFMTPFPTIRWIRIHIRLIQFD